MGLLERVQAARGPSRDLVRRADGPLDPADYWFNYGGYTYFGTPSTSQRNSETIEADFQGLVQQAYKQNGVIYACERARLSVFSEARFQFRQIRNGRPGDFFGTQALGILERPWTNGTTGDLLTRMLQEADFAGNAFYTVRKNELRRMRPDWVSIIMGSHDDPTVTPADLDAELLGYAYWPGGHLSGRDPEILMPDEVAHFAPTPDPMAWYRGMSWLTPVVREIMADSAATEHKLAFFRNGATPQVVVSLDKDVKEEAFERFVRKMNVAHQGASNAYRTMYLGGGADVTVVGADLKQLDFKVTQGAGETRVAAAAGVHPTIVGLSEGLQGSSLNAGNFGQARRLFVEGTLSTLWRNVAASLSTLVPAPQDHGPAELWCDTRDVAFLREDQHDAADIQQINAITIRQLIDAGFEPKSVIAAVQANDWTLLVHTGLFSVQLQKPGQTPGSANEPTPQAVVTGPKALARNFNPQEPRRPDGKWGTGGAVKDALKLADRIQLSSDEKLVGSERISPEGGHDVDTVLAVVDSPRGRQIRLGIVPTDDAEKWRAGNKGGTVNLSPRQAAHLRDDLTEADKAAKAAAKKADATWESGGHVDLRDPVAEGNVSTAWGELNWSTYLTDDDPTSWTTSLSAGGSDSIDSVFYPRDLKKLVKSLGAAAGNPAGSSVARAAGHDTTPGHDELHHYWTRDPRGLAQWEHSPKPWTTLVALLTPHVGPEKAKVYASRWFIEVKGYAAGSDKNRVAHGQPPRGHRVGPG